MTDKTSPSYWQDSSSDDESYDSPSPSEKLSFDKWLTLYQERRVIYIDGVARASSAGTKSGSIAHSLVLLTMLALVSRSAQSWGIS